MVLARFSWFYLVLDGFISFEVVLGRLSLFLTLVIIVRRSYYRGWLLHPVWYLNFRYPAANLKPSAEDLDIRPRVWVWIWGLVYKSSADVLGIRYPAEGFIKSGP